MDKIHLFSYVYDVCYVHDDYLLLAKKMGGLLCPLQLINHHLNWLREVWRCDQKNTMAMQLLHHHAFSYDVYCA